MTDVDLFAQFHEAIKRFDFDLSVELQLIDYFSTFFAKTLSQDGNLLIQLFPRSGADDRYFPGKFVEHCGTCGHQLHGLPNDPVCRTCRERRRRPIIKREPGRLESSWYAGGKMVEFPPSMKDDLIGVVTRSWGGEVFGPVYIHELRAFGLVFVDVPVAGLKLLKESFLSRLDEAVEFARLSVGA